MTDEAKRDFLDWFATIDFSRLMDLRVDYAFKLLFGGDDTRFLIALLNAIFANKQIPRIIASLTILNTHLERVSSDDKSSILDVMAKMDDGTLVLIEMHMYETVELVYKTIRSWARTYGEEIAAEASIPPNRLRYA